MCMYVINAHYNAPSIDGRPECISPYVKVYIKTKGASVGVNQILGEVWACDKHHKLYKANIKMKIKYSSKKQIKTCR